MARAVVLGATGHIGAHVVRALLAEGHTVRAAYRSERYLSVLEGLPVERVRVDLDQPKGLNGLLKGYDWIFHTAGYYPSSREDRKAAIDRGVQSTQRILQEIGRAAPRRVVFTSSAATIRAVADRPADESDAEPWPLTAWRSLYSSVKIAMEQEALKAFRQGLPVVVVNPALCIGEYDAHAFSGRAVLAFAKHRIPWYTETLFNVVYTGDVGVGHVRAAEKGRLGDRYLLTGSNIRLKEFAQVVCRQIGRRPPGWELPYPLALAAGGVAEAIGWLTGKDPLFTRQEVRRVRRGYALDGAKAIREFGMPQTPVEEAVRRAIAWFRKEGML